MPVYAICQVLCTGTWDCKLYCIERVATGLPLAAIESLEVVEKYQPVLSDTCVEGGSPSTAPT